MLQEFGAGGALESLEGGEGRSWRAGDVVLKPCDDSVEWSWLGEHLPTVHQDEFRLMSPLPARNGRWVVDGWCAQAALAGRHPDPGRWADVLLTGERFHRAVRHLPRPEFIDARTHPWAVGDRVAWEEAESPKGYDPLDRLLEVRRPLTFLPQLIHGDLTENVLFAEGQDPAVIDVTPYWRPVGYASAVVVADAIAWHEADPEALLDCVAHVDGFPQLFVRALIFRMVTTVEFAQGEPPLAGYQPAVDLAVRLAR